MQTRGDELEVGQDHVLTWTCTSANAPTARIFYSIDGGSTYPYEITQGPSYADNSGAAGAQRSYTWNVDDSITSQLRIKVTDGDDTKVDINIPIALAEVGLKMVPKEKLNVKGQEISIDHILQLIDEGTEGELVNVDIVDKGKETKVRMYID